MCLKEINNIWEEQQPIIQQNVSMLWNYAKKNSHDVFYAKTYIAFSKTKISIMSKEKTQVVHLQHGSI